MQITGSKVAQSDQELILQSVAFEQNDRQARCRSILDSDSHPLPQRLYLPHQIWSLFQLNEENSRESDNTDRESVR